MTMYLGDDDTFAHLLRDLELLSGSKSLLVTVDDLPTIEFVLSMVGMHAEAAARRAQVIAARLRLQGGSDG
ncbi:hypothetical protein ABZ746_25980 [Streptomyces sp. NPDC020096]